MKKMYFYPKMVYCSGVNKDNIKQWLAEHGRTRAWLADQCQAQLGTVNNWLSTSRPVPSKALRIIDALMRADREQTSEPPAPPPSYLVLRITVEEFEEWSQIALAEGMTITDWIVSVIREAHDRAKNAPTLEVVQEDQPTAAKKGA